MTYFLILNGFHEKMQDIKENLNHAYKYLGGLLS